MYVLETIEKVFSSNIRRLRGNRTQAEMAEFAGMAFSTYRNLEQGNNLPERPQREVLAKAFGVPETALFADPDLVPEPTDKELIEMLQKRLEKPEKQLSEYKQKLLDLIASPAVNEDQARSAFALLNNMVSHPSPKNVANPRNKKQGLS